MSQKAYQVIARRWRPRQFSELVGQDHVVQTLGNAIKMGRIAHAYLFVGPRGTGKKPHPLDFLLSQSIGRMVHPWKFLKIQKLEMR